MKWNLQVLVVGIVATGRVVGSRGLYLTNYQVLTDSINDVRPGHDHYFGYVVIPVKVHFDRYVVNVRRAERADVEVCKQKWPGRHVLFIVEQSGGEIRPIALQRLWQIFWLACMAALMGGFQPAMDSYSTGHSVTAVGVTRQMKRRREEPLSWADRVAFEF